jgi:hypothetical protein
MRTRQEGSTVVVSDPKEAAEGLAAKVTHGGGPAACYASVAELVRDRPLSSISVLVLNFRPLPKGILLATLGRMSVEYPGMQKVAVLDRPLPLPIAEYLTSCGVDLLWNGSPDTGDRLASAVDRMAERSPWLASWPRKVANRRHMPEEV